MGKPSKTELRKQVLLGAREYGIHEVLFRNVVAERLGVNVTDMQCLGLLFHKGLATPSELARHTGLTSGATTAMLDRLERSGLIARKPNPEDRRGSLIVLLKAGAARMKPWFDSVGAAQAELISDYSEEQLQVLADFFQRSVEMWGEERRRLLEGARL